MNPADAKLDVIGGVAILQWRIPRVIRPKTTFGTDHGAASPVLAQDDQGRRLVRTPGHKSWTNRLVGFEYASATLVFERDPDPARQVRSDWKRLAEGGRISAASLLTMSDEIALLFGFPKGRGFSADASRLVTDMAEAWRNKQTLAFRLATKAEIKAHRSANVARR